MDNSTNFTFNPRRYEDNLSKFGKKVLSTLVDKWKSDRTRARNTFQQRFSSSIQNRRVLHFRDEGSFIRPPPLLIEKEIHKTANDFYYENSLDLNVIERNLPHVPTTLELVQAVDTSHNITGIDSINVPARGLINPVINGHIVTNLNNTVSTGTATDLPTTNSRADDNTINDIDWNNMFDTELLPEEIINNEEIFLKQTETPAQNNFNIDLPRKTVKKANKTKTNDPQLKSDKETLKSKRKNQAITDAIPQKVKKVSEVNKNSFRKQKYTKAVKNWLDDVNPNNLVEKDEVDNKSTEPYNPIEQNKVTSEVKKNTRKVIQAQLANKDGIMKYGKPNIEKAKFENDNCKTEESAEIANKNVVVKNKAENEHVDTEKSNSKDKRNKPKFVAPIKSQIPVKDVEFKVVTINENNIRDHTDTLSCIRNQEIVTVLVYSNGFSQLNSHHTEETCNPEGFIVSIQDDFFYFQGKHNKIILQALLENNRIVCYEGKVLLIYFKSKLDLDIHNIEIIDAKIGGSLLDPDSPPENFSDLQKLLSFTPQFTIATECVLQKTAWYATLLKECASKLTSLLMQEGQVWNVFVDIEMKLLPIIAEMERRGVSIDLHKLKSMEEILLTKMKSVELECYKAAGKTFQINSHVQVRGLIYDELQLDAKCNIKIRETISKGAKSTSESMLRSLVSEHSLPKLILEYRHLHKAHATFLAGIAQHVKDGIVRPTWVQTAAATGRIASNNPNLQAIPKAPFSLVLFPKPQDEAPESAPGGALRFRGVYRSRAGYSLVAADFQHVECRVFALAAGDVRLQAALRAPDLFRVLAATWLNKPESEVSVAERERTKRIVYASLYGAGVRKLMDILDLGYDQALAITASFNSTFPALKSFGRAVARACAAGGGRLATASGRARRLPHIASADPARRAQAERQAVNFVVQGAAADLCKKAMVRTEARLRARRPAVRAALLLQIHDELVWEVRDHHVRAAAVLIKEVMEGCGYESGMPATLPVSISTGKNWGEMTEYQTNVPDQ